MPERKPQEQLAALQQTAEVAIRRSLGSPALFALVYATVASALYFSLGSIADHAGGLTPVVFGLAAVFFVLTVMTYVEGASLHQERAGATVFARYAFNELVSFVAGWAILLDYVILVALTALAATNYLGAFWSPLGHGKTEAAVAIAIVVVVAVANVVGPSPKRMRRIAMVSFADIGLQVLVIALGFALVFDADKLLDPIHLGSAPRWSDAVYALVIAAAAASTGLDASSGLAGEVAIGRRGLRRLVAARAGTVLLVYVGVSLVALSALPVHDGHTALGGRFLDAPLLGVVGSYSSHMWLDHGLRYLVGAVGAVVLIAAANSATLGLARVGYSLATNRQIPSAVGRLHPTRSTPVVVIAIAAALAITLVLVGDIEFLIGIYAFGAMLTFTIAHISVIVLRFSEPERDRPYRMPLAVRVGGGSVPVPAVVGALLAAAGWVSIVILHAGARNVGSAWMAFGIALYVVYRLTEGKPLLKRVTIPAKALVKEAPEAEYGSILVPLLGTPLDDDIMQTAGRLARDEAEAEPGEDDGARIEALWIFQIPLALPLDAALPDSQVQAASRALAHAKEVGEEYGGVEVSTAKVRSRRIGQAIVEQAKRFGVEVIVLGAAPPSRIRSGALLGGRGGPLDNYVSDVTRYVIDKAPCRVILTAPPAEDGAAPLADGAVPATDTQTNSSADPGAS